MQASSFLTVLPPTCAIENGVTPILVDLFPYKPKLIKALCKDKFKIVQLTSRQSRQVFYSSCFCRTCFSMVQYWCPILAPLSQGLRGGELTEGSLRRTSVVYRQHFQRTSSLKIMGQFHLNLICSLQAKGGRKVYIFRPGHMT